MKKPVTLFLILLAICGTVKAQSQYSYCILRIENLPTIHRWDYRTDWSETGNWTHEESGRDTTSWSFANDLKKGHIYSYKDYIHFYDLGERTKVDILIDSVSGRFNQLKLWWQGSDAASRSYFTFGMDKLTFVETDSTFEFRLTGDKILGHNLSLDSSYNFGGSGCCWYQDWFNAVGTVLPTSVIYFSISKQGILAVNEPTLPADQITLYPIPTSNILNALLPISSDVKLLTISDILGKKILTIPVTPTMTSLPIDVSFLPPGIYYLRAGQQMQKFVIQR